jgi:protein SDA1
MSTSHSLGDLSKWPLLQNKIKRDPGGYVDEFSRALLHFRSSLDLFRLKPNADDRELPALLSFVSNVAPCYAKRADVQSLGPELMTVLEAHADALSPSIRMSLVQALILLRNRGLAPHVEVLGLFFKLFKTHDRPLRRYLHEHIVGEIKSVNIKRKNHTLNRQLQNFMYGMLADDNALAARHSLDVMVELYRRQVWNDAKTVNVIATGAFHKSGHMVTVALRFLLGRDVDDDDDDDDDDDNEDMAPVDPEVKRARVRLLADTRKLALNSQNGTKANAKKRKYLRAQKALTRTRAGSGGARGQFSPIALLNDPQGFAERLLSGLRASTANFELRLLMMATVSQLIASHQLLVLNYYPWLQKYVQPHQAQVSQILAYAAQACHELVPPDALEPVIRAIVNHFVSDRSRPEVIAIGINTLREICVRVPTALDETLLHDLVQYRKDRDKVRAAAAACACARACGWCARRLARLRG